MQTTAIELTLNTPATHVDVQPGDEIVISGSFQLEFDGATIDATATSGGQPLADRDGLLDLEAGGFQVTSRYPAKHEVHAIATGHATLCGELGVAAPCLPLRLVPLAHSRLITVDQLRTGLHGSFMVEIPLPPIGWSPRREVTNAIPIVAAIVGAMMIVAILFGVMSWARARARSPRARLVALADRVKYKADRADPALAAPLMPAVRAAMSALRARKIDASSPQGIRVEQTLEQLEARLDSKALAEKDSREREVADSLIQEIDAAVRAAEEAQSCS